MTISRRPDCPARTGPAHGRAPVAGVAATVGLVLVLYLWTLAPTVTWWHGGADSGELASAAAGLGVPHPTGYPLFVLLGRAATAVPVGDVAGRVNAMNALLAATGAGLAGLTVLVLVGQRTHPLPAALGASACVLACGTAPLYWSQAIIAEVYALHAALVALVLLLQARRGTHPALRGAALGLALTNHLTSAVLLVASLAVTLRPGRWRALAWFGAGVLAPLTLYLLLPVRAAADPVANWGDPDSPSRLLAHITGRQYRDYFQPFAVTETLTALGQLLRTAARELPVVLAPLVAVGGWWLAHHQRRMAWQLALTAAGMLLLAASYRTTDRHVYVLPVTIVLAVLLGTGVTRVAVWLMDRSPRRTVAAATTAVLLVLAAHAVRAGQAVNLRGDDSALAFARETLAALPPGATYYSARDDVTFTLWYAQRTLGLRRDVRVVDVRNPALRGVP